GGLYVSHNDFHIDPKFREKLHHKIDVASSILFPECWKIIENSVIKLTSLRRFRVLLYCTV
ncbi:MAG: hypothetical protein WBA24_13500, partial [Geitlerinemataceae cyanobacterium]